MGNKFVTRAISGIVLVVVMVALLWWNYYSRFAILTVIGLAGCWEFLSIFKRSGVTVSRIFAVIAAATVAGCSLLEIPLSLPIATMFLARGIYGIYRKEQKPMESIAYETLAIAYTVLPMILFYQLNVIAIFAVVIFVWVNDVGAYLVGSSIGKRKLFERLSPKKSWEGFFGGFILTIIAGLIFNELTEYKSLIYWIVVSVAVSLSAVFGDLFESMLKRSTGIKDSGNIIPGHGGVLDRFDALYFAALSIYVVEYIFNQTDII